jgi:hypothetical protein
MLKYTSALVTFIKEKEGKSPRRRHRRLSSRIPSFSLLREGNTSSNLL